ARLLVGGERGGGEQHESERAEREFVHVLDVYGVSLARLRTSVAAPASGAVVLGGRSVRRHTRPVSAPRAASARRRAARSRLPCGGRPDRSDRRNSPAP